MGEERSAHDVEALLEHTSWLRSLARALLGEGGGDAGAADDLVQDALVVALQRREPPAGNPRSWLGGVLRNLARGRRRGELRRGRRERERGPHPDEPATHEVLERADLQRRLIGHVFALEEPYRSTLLLRYFEGLSGEELARRQGVPASTARTHLARGLERLRARLDAEHGGERGAWCALFLPLALRAGEAAGATTALTGWEVLGMGVNTKLAVGAGLLAALAATVVVLRGEGEHAAAELGQAEVALAAPQMAGPSPEESAQRGVAGPAAADMLGERRALEQKSAPPPELGTLVFGSVLGPSGERVPKGSITLIDALGRATPASFGAPGTWSVMGLAPGAHEVLISCPGFVETASALEIAPGAGEVRHDLRLDPALSIPVRFTDEAGAPLDLRAAGWGYVSPVVVATVKAPAGTLPGIEGRNAAYCGAGLYEYRGPFGGQELDLAPQHDGILHLRVPLPVWVSAVLRDQVVETRHLEGPVEELVFQIPTERAKALLGGLRLRAVDAQTGAPLAGGSATLDFRDGGAGAIAFGPDGRIELVDQAPGVRVLQVQGADNRSQTRNVRVLPGTVIDLGDVPIASNATLTGRVVDEHGAPVATSLTWFSVDAVAFVQDVDTSWSVSTASDGTFALTCGRTRVAVLAASREWAREPRVVDASGGDVAGLELVVRRGVEVRLRQRDAASVGARFTLATDEGFAFDSGQVWSTAPWSLRLSPGRYQVWSGWDETVLERRPFEVPVAPEDGAVRLDLPPLGSAR